MEEYLFYCFLPNLRNKLQLTLLSFSLFVKSDEDIISTEEVSTRATLLDIDNELDIDTRQDSDASVASENVEKNRDNEAANVPPLIDLLVRLLELLYFQNICMRNLVIYRSLYVRVLMIYLKKLRN